MAAVPAAAKTNKSESKSTNETESKPTNETESKPTKKVPKKLVLCFDGTGNTFQGNTGDTNVVKIFDKLNRDCDDQYHYYQTGIGTYDISGGSVNKSFFGKISSSISSTLDSGFATTFDAHVMAGYRFVMRYYDRGDKIYMFGFSRGAFTARFLARMINRVGLLSKGNEEMVPFVYQLYQTYEQGKHLKDEEDEKDKKKKKPETTQATTGSSGSDAHLLNGPTDTDAYKKPLSDEELRMRAKLEAFTSTFCRRELDENNNHTGVKVYFLGLFDCVNSVSVLESPFGTNPKAVSVIGTAQYVRHAVAIDERRVKFRPALLLQDTNDSSNKDDIKEVWFPGNHGDVGGGWPAPEPVPKKGAWWRFFRKLFFGEKKVESSPDVAKDSYQMSDVPLHWMLDEVKKVGEKEKDYAIQWSERLDGFEHNFEKRKEQALQAAAHDTLRFSGGSGFFKVLFWKFSEILPLPRWEIDSENKWYYDKYSPNLGGTRDIPRGAVFHESVHWRLKNGSGYEKKVTVEATDEATGEDTDGDANQNPWKKYKPQNNLGSKFWPWYKTDPCLLDTTDHKALEPVQSVLGSKHHNLYRLNPKRTASS